MNIERVLFHGVMSVPLAIIVAASCASPVPAQPPLGSVEWHDVGGGLEAYSPNPTTTCYHSKIFDRTTLTCVSHP